VLEERGRKVVLINLPVTYPPLTKHITLTSLLTQGDNAVFPETLKEQYPALRSYRCFPDTALRAKGQVEAYLQDIRALESARFACLKALWGEPWDVFFCVVSGTDWVSHEAFPQLIEGRYDEASEALGMFQDADANLGWVLERLRPDDHLLMVSDHGFCTAKGIFYLNEWLEEQGFLSPDYERPTFPPSHRMEEAALKAAEGNKAKIPAGILSAVHRRGAARFFAKVARKLGVTWPLSLAVDHGHSRASTLTAECHGITVHDDSVFPDGAVAPCDVPGVSRQLEEALRDLRDPDGESVFASVERREGVYHGPKTAEAAHLLLGPDKWGVAAAIKALKNIPFVNHPVGIHATEGLFLGAGPAFASGRLPARSVDITDVAPLLFHLLGEPIPELLDGQLVEPLFAEGYLAGRPPAFASVGRPDRSRQDMDAEAIQERLRGLGYMG
jgi:predicted AlkP superfamily phosphohydrolase/phosphomutase